MTDHILRQHEQKRLLAEGSRLTGDEAKEVQTHLINVPDDLSARVKIIVFQNTKLNREAYARSGIDETLVDQFDWLFENVPGMIFFPALLEGCCLRDVIQMSRLHKTWIGVLDRDRTLPVLLNAHKFLEMSCYADRQLREEVAAEIESKRT